MVYTKNTMSIVVITIPGDAQKEFVNALHRGTEGGVALVIIQHPKASSIVTRILRFCRRAGFPRVFIEVWYALLLRLRPEVRKALGYFQVPAERSQKSYEPPVMWTDSVNADAVYRKLQAISPDLLAVWGSAVLDPRIIATAQMAINVHFGHSPEYRGALANQHAVLNGDYALIGATIHHMRDTVDSGDILEQITIDLAQPPHVSFPAFTTRARERFIEILSRLHAGEKLPARAQEPRESRILFLREWVPSVRYAVGTRILALEEAYQASAKQGLRGHRLAALGLIAIALSGGSYVLLFGCL